MACTVRVFYTLLLSFLELSLGMEMPAQPEAERCLMQKQHQVLRATASIGGHHHHSSRSQGSKLRKHHQQHRHHRRASLKKAIETSNFAQTSGSSGSDSPGGRARTVQEDDAEMRNSSTNSSNSSDAPNLHELLPEPVLALAWRLFEKEPRIVDLVQNSVAVNLTYAGVRMTLRMSKDDDPSESLDDEDEWFSYDLDTLGDVREHNKDTLNLLDLGGSYGIFTIAAFQKYQKHLRVITVEPTPTTFFFLKWNLHLNGVPEIELADLENKSATGVLAMNRGTTDDANNEDLHFCLEKSGMNAELCDCKKGDERCLAVPSETIYDLAGMFGTDPIAMIKMDCEGCEAKTLPALVNSEVSQRVRRLAGELHLPDSYLEELACRWDGGRLVTKCQRFEHDDVFCGTALTCPQ